MNDFKITLYCVIWGIYYQMKIFDSFNYKNMCSILLWISENNDVAMGNRGKQWLWILFINLKTYEDTIV